MSGTRFGTLVAARVLENIHRPQRRPRVITLAGQVIQAVQIGFLLLLAGKSLASRDKRIALTAAKTAYDGCHRGSILRRLHALQLLGGVAASHMSDLMAEYCRQLRLVFEPAQKPARDIDLPAWKRERIDLLGVEDLELACSIVAHCEAGGALANLRDISLERRIGVDSAKILFDPGDGLHHRDFLLVRHRTAGEEAKWDDRAQSGDETQHEAGVCGDIRGAGTVDFPFRGKSGFFYRRSSTVRSNSCASVLPLSPAYFFWIAS